MTKKEIERAEALSKQFGFERMHILEVFTGERTPSNKERKYTFFAPTIPQGLFQILHKLNTGKFDLDVLDKYRIGKKDKFYHKFCPTDFISGEGFRILNERVKRIKIDGVLAFIVQNFPGEEDEFIMSTGCLIPETTELAARIVFAIHHNRALKMLGKTSVEEEYPETKGLNGWQVVDYVDKEKLNTKAKTTSKKKSTSKKTSKKSSEN